MRKLARSIDEPEPKTPRADRPPTKGFVVIVDGHFKSVSDTVEAAEAAGRKLKSTYPMLQIERNKVIKMVAAAIVVLIG
jgi:hypothetical protein